MSAAEGRALLDLGLSPSSGTWLLPTSKVTELTVRNKLTISSISPLKLNATPLPMHGRLWRGRWYLVYV